MFFLNKFHSNFYIYRDVIICFVCLYKKNVRFYGQRRNFDVIFALFEQY